MDFLVEKSVELGAGHDPSRDDRAHRRALDQHGARGPADRRSRRTMRADGRARLARSRAASGILDRLLSHFRLCGERGNHPPLPCGPQAGEVGTRSARKAGFPRVSAIWRFCVWIPEMILNIEMLISKCTSLPIKVKNKPGEYHTR